MKDILFIKERNTIKVSVMQYCKVVYDKAVITNNHNITHFDWQEFSDTVYYSQIVERYLLNLPMDIIVGYEEKYNQHHIIKGQSILQALVMFRKGLLELKGLKYLTALNGLSYNSVSRQYIRNLDKTGVDIIILLPCTEREDEAERNKIMRDYYKVKE